MDKTKTIRMKIAQENIQELETHLITHSGMKRPQENIRELETHLFTHSGISKKHYTGNHNVYTEDLMQPHAGPLHESFFLSEFK